MGYFKKLKLRFWHSLAIRRNKYTKKYGRMAGVQIAESVRFTGCPAFGTEPWLISIGENCIITQNVRFMTHDGAVNVVCRMGGKYADLNKFGRIIVEDNVFIGANAMIMPSVRIGSGSIVATCSCVTKDVPPGEVWGGVPAKKICTVQEFADKLYEISKDYQDDVSCLSDERKISEIVADAYRNSIHNK